MSPITIKAPNPDSIWEIWKKKNSGDLEKHFAIKGAKFTPENVTVAENVKSVEKHILLVFDKTTSTKISGKTETAKDSLPKVLKMRWFGFDIRPDKNNWKHGDRVPDVDTLTSVKCPKCGGKLGPKCNKCGGSQFIKCSKCEGHGLKCSDCNGSGKRVEEIEVILGNNDRKKKKLEFSCATCFGLGKITCPDCGNSGKIVCKECHGAGREKCNECDGIGVIYQYQIIPTPFQDSKNSEKMMLASVKSQEIEHNFGEELHKLLDNAEYISLKNPDNELSTKFFEPTIGAMTKDIKKTIEETQKIWESTKKSKSDTINLPIHLYLLTVLRCQTKKGKFFSVMAIGTEARYITAGDL